MTSHPDANGVVGWTMTPTEVVADLQRMLASIKRVQRTTGDPATRSGAARNADTLASAIRLIEVADG